MSVVSRSVQVPAASPDGLRRLIVMAVVTALAAIGISLATGPAAQAADPAIFKAGAAASNINPDTPQYIGGYGFKGGPTMDVNDDLEVRAFVVGKGKDAAVFVSADLTGWFSAYHGADLEPYGIDRTREKIATALKSHGFEISRESVVINVTHTHSAPAIVGIWGPPDPAYVQKVSEAALDAAVRAAAGAKTSEIWTAVGDVRSFVWQNGQGTNHPDGFEADNQLPVMWARDPKTGATNAIYANVPNHPDQFRGEAHNKLSADWPGYARKMLDAQNGGVSVIAAGTLGRQEPPGSVNTYDEVIPQGEYVANEIQRTLAKATPLTSDRIAASEKHFTFDADNAALIGLIQGYRNPGTACLDSLGYCPIPRSKAPEYFVEGSGGALPKVGATTSAVRVGDVVYATNPGEAFPEVNRAIRESISGARHVNAVGLTDMLGYYYVRSDYTSQQFGSSNFETYNVGEDFPQINADKAREAAADLGFQTAPKTVHAPFDADVENRPGLQWYPDQLESADPTINIYGTSARSQDKLVPAPDTIQWNFGDGTTATTNDGDRFDHTFPGPGTYEVTATVTGSNAKTRTWTDTIKINPPLSASATLVKRAWNVATLKVDGEGGSGKYVGARWTCHDGTQAEGLNVSCAGKKSGEVTVTLVDGAGNTATASVAVSKAPAKIRLVSAKPKNLVLKRGKKKAIRVKVRNAGGTAAKNLKVCVGGKARGVYKPARKCVKGGSLAAGKAKTVRVVLRGKKKGKTKVTLTVRSRNGGSAKTAVKVRTKK
ncbi:MAG: PKD domain-containing protein [Actinomycetota bacterium]|nr:PKD domain-containing protein [Actinomycetota bacterium]